MPRKPKTQEPLPFPENVGMTLEEIADGIRRIDAGIKLLESGPIRKKAVLILLSHITKMSQKDVDIVLQGLSEFRRTVLKS